MSLKKRDKVIVEIETFGEVVAYSNNRVTVRIGTKNYELSREKVRKIILDNTVDIIVQEELIK